jgi:hypothetical protein
MALSLGMASCDVLDVTPIDPGTVMKVDANGLMNKCYANMAIAGQQGPDDGDCDVDGLDGGTTGFVRQLWNANELPTDEAMCCWGDDGISSLTSTSTQVHTRCCRASTIVFIPALTIATTILRSVPTTMPQ